MKANWREKLRQIYFDIDGDAPIKAQPIIEFIESLLSKHLMEVGVKTGLEGFKIHREEMAKYKKELVEKVDGLNIFGVSPSGEPPFRKDWIGKEEVLTLIRDD